MTTQLEIDNIEEETVEVTLAELEMLKSVMISITDQNTLIVDNMEALRLQMVAQAENLTATFASLVDAIAGLSISVNVPKQPAPVVNVAAPAVTLNTPQKEKNVAINVKRDKEGRIASATGTIK